MKVRLLAPLAFAALMAGNLALAQEVKKATAAKSIPVLYSTDLHHPHVDPDDHFDLATLFAIPEFDIRGIVLDCGERQLKQPGKIPLEQMMHLTKRRVPYEIGLARPLKATDDEGRSQPPEFQKGVEMILDVLRKSPEKVTIVTAGSLRDVAAALNRDAKLFQWKVARLYINIGDAAVRKDYNVDLDVHSWVRIMRSGLPVYWCACGDGGDWTRGCGYSTWWQFRQRDFLLKVPPPLQNYFAYALARIGSVDPLAYLSRHLSPKELDFAFIRCHQRISRLRLV